MTLTQTRLASGIWEGLLTAPDAATPRLTASHLGHALDGLDVAAHAPGQWNVRLPVPPALISDGVQTIVITDADSGETLATFTLVAGEPLAEDLRAEISLLRAELDMLKLAFRRYAADHP
jgi:hypothetical protein